ncbi:glycosyltransferase family 2 protein [Flavobacterium sp. RSP29]|uniref:glycosyltransferase family 2 protein n=1 Tax=Flavobacterium sp. RSP29 TaxID=3401731 RepID=UPI003AADF39C
MSVNPLVSIQIPTYNQPQFIKEAIDSALAQTYENLQIIVADDCSPDYDILEYLSDYKDNPKVLLHRNPKNMGRVANYRACLYHLVKGEWFMNLDGDDFLINKNFITNAIASINQCKNEEIAFYKGNTSLQKIEESKITKTKLSEYTFLIGNKDYLANLQHDFGFSHGAQLYHTNKAKSVNIYNRNLLDIDYFSFLKCISTGNIIINNQPVYHWRIHEAQETHTISPKEYLKRFEAVNELKQVYRDMGTQGKSAIAFTRMMVYIYFLHTVYNQRNLWQFLPSILSKTKRSTKYILPLLATFKNYYFPKKK